MDRDRVLSRRFCSVAMPACARGYVALPGAFIRALTASGGFCGRDVDGDLDLDGDVDLSDLAALLAVYGTTCP